MLELYEKKISPLPSAEREKVEREIKITDEKIDEIVYGLYGITDEEMKIIEKKGMQNDKNQDGSQRFLEERKLYD